MNNRNVIGIDINLNAVEITKNKLNFDCYKETNIDVMLGDACNLKIIEDNSIDLICTHPPYADVTKYSDGIASDLSQLKIQDFLEKWNKLLLSAIEY